MPKTAKSVSAIAVSNKYTSKILGQDVNKRPLFGLLTETLGLTAKELQLGLHLRQQVKVLNVHSSYHVGS